MVDVPPISKKLGTTPRFTTGDSRQDVLLSRFPKDDMMRRRWEMVAELGPHQPSCDAAIMPNKTTASHQVLRLHRRWG